MLLDAGSMGRPTGRSAGHMRRRRCFIRRPIEDQHPQAHLAKYSGILQADAFGGYTKLYELQRSPGAIREAACWVHARRPFFAMADLEENARRKAAGQKEIALSTSAIGMLRRSDAPLCVGRPDE